MLPVFKCSPRRFAAMHKDDSKEFLKTLQPMGRMVAVKDIVDAVLYLSQAGQVTGEGLPVARGGHAGPWEKSRRVDLELGWYERARETSPGRDVTNHPHKIIP